MRLRAAAWLAIERRRAVLWVPVLVGAGVVIYFNLRQEPPLWLGPVVASAGTAIAVAGWQQGLLRGVGIGLAAVGLGIGSGSLSTWRALPLETLPRRAVIVTGTVRSAELLPEGRRVTIAAPRLDPSPGQVGDPVRLQRLIRVRLRNADPVEIAAGDTIRVRALLRAPAPPDYPGGWDQQRDAYFAGRAGSGFAIGFAERIVHAPPVGIARWWQGIRDAIADQLLSGLPGARGAIAATLLTGTSTAIPPADRAAFRDSGLAHLLAVAGLHIGIVMGLALSASRLLLALWEWGSLHLPTKQIAAVVALAAGGLYLALTGMHLPIIRSFVMALLVTLGVLTGRRAFSVRGLALAAIVLLLTLPQEAMTVSFQMSFSAVLALIAGYEALRPLLRRLHGQGELWRRMLHHCATLSLTSLLAGLASAPFAAYHFGHIQIYFVLANLLAVPITALWVMPAGLASLLLMPFGLARVALQPMGWGIGLLLGIARHVAAWPAATLDVPHMPGWGLALVALGIVWLGLWRSPLRLAGTLPLVIGLLSPWLIEPPDILVAADGRLIATAAEGHLLVERQTGWSKFTLAAWQQFWAMGPAEPFPSSGPAFGDGAVNCNAAGCRVSRNGTTAFLRTGDPDAPPPDCTAIAVLISPRPADKLCQGMATIDRFTVWREGAQAVWLRPGGVRILSDQSVRGSRPWVPLPHPARSAPHLPIAQSVD